VVWKKRLEDEIMENKKFNKEEWYAMNRDIRLEKCREYYVKNKTKILELNKKWREEHPIETRYMRSKNQKDYEIRYPEKIKAHQLANNKIKIVKGIMCEICKKEQAKHRHHPDYSKPLEVVLVCIKCHNKLHMESE
jgi:hypothetical protein